MIAFLVHDRLRISLEDGAEQRDVRGEGEDPDKDVSGLRQ